MAFFFDFCIDQLVHYAQTYKTVQKTSRRKKQEGDMTKIWEVKLHNLILLTLQKCFAYDKENDFIDSSKFDKIVDPLVDQLDCIGIPVKYDNFIDNSVQPAIIELFELVKDDYKWKSLNYALLMKTRSEVSTIRLAAIKILLRVIEQLKERTAVLIQDILPFLSETLEDEDIQVIISLKNYLFTFVNRLKRSARKLLLDSNKSLAKTSRNTSSLKEKIWRAGYFRFLKMFLLCKI